MNETLLKALAALPPCRDEDRLHRFVTDALEASGLDYFPEHRLDARNRIDFLIEGPPRVGIECKTGGSALQIMRQIYRYAEHLDHIILITTKPLAMDRVELLDSRGQSVRLDILELWKNSL